MDNKELYYLSVYTAITVLYCIYPLAGFLADNRIGRFITVHETTKFILLLLILEGITLLANILMEKLADRSILNRFFNILAAVVFLMVLLTFIVRALFNANIIQFDVD